MSPSYCFYKRHHGQRESLPLSHKALTGAEPRQQLLYAECLQSQLMKLIGVMGVSVASLRILLLVWPLSLWGWPATGRCTRVPYFFHLLMMELTELWGMFSDLFTEMLGVFFCPNGMSVLINQWLDVPVYLYHNHMRHIHCSQVIYISLIVRLVAPVDWSAVELGQSLWSRCWKFFFVIFWGKKAKMFAPWFHL